KLSGLIFLKSAETKLLLTGMNCPLYDKIAVFDWDGNPKYLYKSDYRIMSLSVENDTTVYACLETEDGKHFVGKASLKL
ncbi:MAG: hypothetical protein ACI39T_01230, partial [Candidatus Cryptobacteroides sp.]